MSLLQVHGVNDMENRLKYEDNKNYSGLGNYDNKVSSLASKHRTAKKELKAALDEYIYCILGFKLVFHVSFLMYFRIFTCILCIFFIVI